MGSQVQDSGLSRFRREHLEFFCGWGSGVVETTLLFPTSKLVFRQQLLGLAVNEAAAQLKNEGVMYLYRGLLPPLLMRTTTRSIMFGMFEKYKKLLGCHHPGTTSTLTSKHALAAFLAGVTEATLCPLERIQVLLQNSMYHQDFRNTHEAFYSVAKYGPREFYRGYTLIIFRNGMSNILFFTLREPLREQIINKAGQNGTNISQAPLIHFASNFVSGAILGASISTLFFPVNVVKHRMQSVLGTPFESPLAVFRVVWKERNRSIKELYRGVQMNFTRSLVAWGITNSVYEILLNLLK
ncbi:Solute carrier family 25 member 51 [Aphelenchoides bicaudatus]|nr:Solute carrier family 25 member 51 [Aphelenchoides bicaudatus]